MSCDDSGRYVIGHRAANSTGVFVFSDDFGSTWDLRSSGDICYGLVTRDGGMAIYGNGTARELSVTIDSGSTWNDIDVSTEFPTADWHIRVRTDGSNDTVYVFQRDHSSKIYKFVKGDSGITEWYDIGNEVLEVCVSQLGLGMCVRDVDGNLYYIEDVDAPNAVQIWDGTVSTDTKNQATFSQT